MKLWIIENKVSGEWLPEPRTGRVKSGICTVEPNAYPHTKPPRLYRTERGAEMGLKAWQKGRYEYAHRTRGGLKQSPVQGRDAPGWEVRPYELAPAARF